MKKIKLLLFACIFSVSLKAQTPNDTTNLNGIWLYNGANATTLTLNNINNLPFRTIGAGVYTNWKNLETSDGNFTWTSFDISLQKIASANMYINLMIWAGPGSPQWIYDSAPNHQVDSVKTNQPDFLKYPYYFHPNYKTLWFKMLDSVIVHLNHLPTTIKDKIKIVQSAQGTTGDLSWYKGDAINTPSISSTCACSDYTITPYDWSLFIRREWQRTDSMLKIYLPKGHHLINAGGDSPFDLPEYIQNFIWSRANMSDVWYKAENMGHGYELNSEIAEKKMYDTLANVSYSLCMPKSRLRDEFDMSKNTTYTTSTIPWTIYTSALNSLYFGVDIWSIFTGDIQTPACLSSIQFFSKYAGQKNAACSPGAFSALRDGLDAANFTRFPSPTFGPGFSVTANSLGMQRCTNIANYFSAYGAAQLSPLDAQRGASNQASALGLNDVGWGIFPSNYERFLTQWTPSLTSQGYWRQGPQSEPYGRFARGFDHGTGKDTMFFNLEDSFFSVFPNNGTNTIKLRLIYLDQGSGTFDLKYDAVGTSFKTAKSYTTTNTGSWIIDTVTITDAYFGNRCNHGTDIALLNSDNTNEIFHMLEVIRVVPFTTGINEKTNPPNKLIIYPNPGQNIITFDYSNYNEETFDRLIIYNILGENVYSIAIDNSYKQLSIDLKKLATGIYTSVLIGKNTRLINKIIKQ